MNNKKDDNDYGYIADVRGGLNSDSSPEKIDEWIDSLFRTRKYFWDIVYLFAKQISPEMTYQESYGILVEEIKRLQATEKEFITIKAKHKDEQAELARLTKLIHGETALGLVYMSEEMHDALIAEKNLLQQKVNSVQVLEADFAGKSHEYKCGWIDGVTLIKNTMNLIK